MKVLKYGIEKVTTTFPTGGVEVIYRVKFLKKGFIFSRWKYIMQYDRAGSKDIAAHTSLHDAQHAIVVHKVRNGRSVVSMEEFNEDGTKVLAIEEK